MKKELHVGETSKHVIRKSGFFCKIHRHVRHSMILICTLISSMEKIDQHFEKMFTKNIISPTCNNKSGEPQTPAARLAKQIAWLGSAYKTVTLF